MKVLKFLYSTICLPLIVSLVFFSCTDTTTDNVSNEQLTNDTLFTSISESTFTGIRDTAGYTLLVNSVSIAEYNSIPLINGNDDSLRNVICNSEEGGCMEKMENYYLSKFPSKALRNGPELVLTLSNGTNKIFQNIAGDDNEFEVYQFLTLDDNGHYIVPVNYLESYGTKLVNAINGNTIETIGNPIFSPNKKLYAAGNFDMVAGFTYNGLELISVSNNSLQSEVKIDFSTWGPEEIKWKDDSTLYVKQKSQLGDNLEVVINYGAIRIRRKNQL